MGLLSHRYLVLLIAVHTSDQPFYIVTELMPEGDLKEYLRSCRPALSDCKEMLFFPDLLRMALQISAALQYLEFKHVIHRDIAARNVLVKNKECVKLSDFGMSRNLIESDYYKKTSEDRVPVKWMAPESINDRIYTNLSDVWSFGILCWEITSYAMAPYGEYTAMESVAAIAAGFRLKQPENCSDDLYGLMMQCWQYRASERPTFVIVYEKMQAFNLAAKLDDSNYAQRSNITDVAIDDAGYVTDNVGGAASGTPFDTSQYLAGIDKLLGGGNSATDDGLAGMNKLLNPSSVEKTPSSKDSSRYDKLPDYKGKIEYAPLPPQRPPRRDHLADLPVLALKHLADLPVVDRDKPAGDDNPYEREQTGVDNVTTGLGSSNPYAQLPTSRLPQVKSSYPYLYIEPHQSHRPPVQAYHPGYGPPRPQIPGQYRPQMGGLPRPGQYAPPRPQMAGQYGPPRPQMLGQYAPSRPQMGGPPRPQMPGQYAPPRPQMPGQYAPPRPQMPGQYALPRSQMPGQYGPLRPQMGAQYGPPRP